MSQTVSKRPSFLSLFEVSATETFHTMCGCLLKKSMASFGPDTCVLSGVIGLSGQARGSVVLHVEDKVALGVASKMLGEPITELGEDAMDTVAELANMVAGCAKAKIQNLDLSISLPNVITGNGQNVTISSRVDPETITLESPWGLVVIDLVLEIN